MTDMKSYWFAHATLNYPDGEEREVALGNCRMDEVMEALARHLDGDETSVVITLAAE